MDKIKRSTGMTIEEAIQHCKEQAAKLRKDSTKCLQIGLMHAANDCEECATEHEQLAEWLEELKQHREAEITTPPKSNGDRIRHMTDEELAEWIDNISCCGVCVLNPCKCTDAPCLHKHENVPYVEKWLKQEIE
jgi:hypothetical protein